MHSIFYKTQKNAILVELVQQLKDLILFKDTENQVLTDFYWLTI